MTVPWIAASTATPSTERATCASVRLAWPSSLRSWPSPTARPHAAEQSAEVPRLAAGQASGRDAVPSCARACSRGFDATAGASEPGGQPWGATLEHVWDEERERQ